MTEQNNELHENYRQILDQVEILARNPNLAADPAIKNSFKVISDRLQRLLPAETTTTTTLDEKMNEISNPSSVDSKVETIVENDEVPSSSTGIANEMEPTTTSNIDSLDIRITYESPLEMMRSNKTKYAHQQKTKSQLKQSHHLTKYFKIEAEIYKKLSYFLIIK